LNGELSKAPFKMTLQAQSEAELLREYPKVDAEYHRQVKAIAAKRVGLPGALSPLEAWKAAVAKGNELVAGVIGLDGDDDARRDVLADSLYARGADPLLLKAILAPDSEAPERTLKDAVAIYLNEKLGGGEGSAHREARVRLERVFARVWSAMGDRADVPLVALTRQDAKDVVAYMLASEKYGGGSLSPASVKREIAQVKAVVAYAIKEFDLEGKAFNRFSGLEIAGTVGIAAEVASTGKRLPLPVKVITAMREKLSGELQHIWGLLEGTGCRLAEITGLRREDVTVDGDRPHIRVQWHEDRRVKTRSSIRSVPLVGDALEAAREALKLAEGRTALFPGYARERGADAASSILMKHLRTFTTDKRHTVHSLRHNMKDRLRKAGVEKILQDFILGHSAPGVGEGYARDGDGTLEATSKAMRLAFGGL